MSNDVLNITLIGCGNVGEAVGFLLVNQSENYCINIMEPNPQKRGKWLELTHIAGLHRNLEVVYNDSSLLKRAHWIFYTAGAGIKIGQNRRDVVKENVELANQIFGNISFENEPYIVVMTNPVDAMTFFVRKITGFDRTKVWGTGTSIDSARFSAVLKRLKVTDKHIEASVAGEHGNAMVLLFSQLKQAEIRKVISEQLKSEIIDLTVKAASEVKQTQDATYTAVASCAVKLMNIFTHKEVDQHLFFNTLTDDYLTEKLEISKPIDFSWNYNIHNQLNSKRIELLDNEWKLLKASAKDLEKLIDEFS